MKKSSCLVSWWLTPSLPEVHVKEPGGNPLSSLKKWFLHPVKRRLARMYLKLLQKFTDIKVIGITGSAGKTTTKEMLYSILKLRNKTVCTRKNIDPVYNIPDTILRTPIGTKYLILEMGVEYPGEMDFYLWLAKPDIGVITNIFATHTEFLGDVPGVFKEKKKLVEAISSSGFAVLNKENQFLKRLDGKLKSKIIWFGKGSGVSSSKEKIVDFRSEFILSFKDSDENLHVTLQMMGSQYVGNALAASTTAHVLGVTTEVIKKGLEKFDAPPHRMHIIKHRSGALILDDTYNNNPEAAKESISTFNKVAGSRDKIVVFGDMLELGNLEQSSHKNIGKHLVGIHLKKLICVGKAVKFAGNVVAESLGDSRVEFADNWEEALVELKPFLKRKSVILVKGSRSIGLDKLVEGIQYL